MTGQPKGTSRRIEVEGAACCRLQPACCLGIFSVLILNWMSLKHRLTGWLQYKTRGANRMSHWSCILIDL